MGSGTFCGGTMNGIRYFLWRDKAPTQEIRKKEAFYVYIEVT